MLQGPVSGLTSTCSFDQPSMLSDLTLDICVPSLRWIDAHRMHRKMPNCHQLVFRGEQRGEKRVGRVMGGCRGVAEGGGEESHVRSMMPSLQVSRVSDGRSQDMRDQRLTWIPRLAVRALVVPGDILNEVL